MKGMSTLYSSEDVGAPVLTYTEGSFVTLLDTVLLNGYGDKPALGWTKEFSGPNKAVYRNKGTKLFLRVQHDRSGNLNRAHMRAYESMTSIDEGTFACPKESFEFYALVGYYDGTHACPWRIIGDDCGFWLFTRSYATKYPIDKSYYGLAYKCYYVGDYIPYDPANVHYNWLMLHGGANNEQTEFRASKLSLFGSTEDRYCQAHVMRHFSGASRPAAIQLASNHITSDSVGGLYKSFMEDAPYNVTFPVHLGYQGHLVMGRIPGLKNPATPKGIRGEAMPNDDNECMAEHKPELCYDYGTYKEHFLPLNDTNGYVCYAVFTEGKGFRNVI
jgi:hypothetical protein